MFLGSSFHVVLAQALRRVVCRQTLQYPLLLQVNSFQVVSLVDHWLLRKVSFLPASEEISQSHTQNYTIDLI